jgi:hypothetical protein
MGCFLQEMLGENWAGTLRDMAHYTAPWEATAPKPMVAIIAWSR